MKRPEGPGPAATPVTAGKRQVKVRPVRPPKAPETRSTATAPPVVRAVPPVTGKDATPKVVDPVTEARRAEKRAAHEAHVAEAERRRFERREARRFTRRSRSRRITWIVLGTSGLLLIGLILVGIFSPLFAVRDIAVIGSTAVDPIAVEAALDGQLGTPLPLVDPASLSAELGAFPLIESYSIERELPNTLVVRLVERTPIGMVKVGTSWTTVDAAGVVLATGAEPNPALPVFTVAEATTDDPGFSAAVQVLDSLPDALRVAVIGVTAATKDDVRLALAGGQQVLWGSAEDSELKVIGLQQLMAAQGASTLVLYDVSSPASLVVRNL